MDDDTLRSSEREEMKAFFAASRHVAPIGNTVAGIIALLLFWGHLDHGWLLCWFGGVVTLAVLQGIGALDPDRFADDLAGDRVLDTNILAGVVWGLVPFLDLAAFGSDDLLRVKYLMFAFAIGAGSMGGLAGLTGIGIKVQAPLFGLAGTALLVTGHFGLGAGVLVFLVLMTSDLRGTSRILSELVSLRVETAARALDAEREARHDSLTGLYNRAGVFARIEQLRGRGPLVAMFVDLDYFKEVNDRLGHEAGDEVLKETARRIQSALRPDDPVARLGGDEFLIFFERADSDLEVISRRVLEAVEQPIRVGDDEASISASIGVTEVDGDRWTTAGVLRQADHALYEAKRTGRQRVVWFDDRLADQLEEKTALETELRRAIADEAIRPVAQPVFEMASGRVLWVEVTPRWELPSGSVVPPSVFVPLAEEMGLSDALTRSILDESALARLRWRTHPTLASSAVLVRVAAGHVMRGSLVDDVGSSLVAHGLGPGEVQLMLTDTADIRDPQHAAEVIEALRAMGVGIVLGEFGSGKSSLRDLLQLPIDVVAVHRRLLADAPNDPRLRRLLAALDHVAGSLGLRVGADGVDSLEQLDVVRELGLPYAQGLALCPPLSFEELESAPEGVFARL